MSEDIIARVKKFYGADLSLGIKPVKPYNLSKKHPLIAELASELITIRTINADLTTTLSSLRAEVEAKSSQAKDSGKPVAWNRKIRDSVDELLAQAGYAADSSARHQLSMMNFDSLTAEQDRDRLLEALKECRPLREDMEALIAEIENKQ